MTSVISVVMPVFNGAAFLAAAVDSILGQSLDDFELLAIDDGSTDATPEILAGYAVQDSRVRILKAGHQGIVAALNRGLAEAKGEFLARMDADDIAHPERFARQIAALRADASIGVLGTYVTCIDVAGRLICVFRGPLTHEEFDAAHLKGGPKLWHPSVMMRTAALREAGGYRDGFPYTEDYDLWLRMGEICRLATLPEPLLSYRLHLDSVSVTKRDQQIKAAHWSLSDAFARRGIASTEMPKTGQDQSPSDLEVIRKWAWWALKEGNIATARYYAWRSLLAAPVSRESLALAVSVLRTKGGLSAR